jgi:subtilisin family serine protease
MSLITINGNSLDPVGHAPILRSLGLEAEDASESDYILIQSSAPFSLEQNQQLEALGVDIQNYVSENTYLCGFKSTDLAAVRALPFITWANIYLKEFKVASGLKQRTASAFSVLRIQDEETASRARKTVDINFHDDVDPSAGSVKAAIAAAAHVDETTLKMSEHKVRLQVEERDLSSLASIDAVAGIQQVHQATFFNNKALPILNAHVAINKTEFKGRGQVIAVADTGFDEGQLRSRHPAFQNTHVANLYSLGRDGKADDPNGHGTHVCGSVLGSGVSKVTGDVIEGVASQATLVVQSLLDDSGGLGGIPDDLTNLFAPPYLNDGARVHTNSWGLQMDRGNPAQVRFIQQLQH